MRVVIAEKFGPPEVLHAAEVNDAAPGQGEALVRARYADVMYLDTQLRAGWGTDFFPITPPYVPGGAVGGEIVAVGEAVDPARVGLTVVSRTADSGIGSGVPTGGYAELVRVKDSTAQVVPDGVDLAAATAIVHDGGTAQALKRAARATPDDVVLVTAAGGGVGVLLVQLLRDVGAQVIAAASPGKQELLARLGVEERVDYTRSSWEHSLPGRPTIVIDGAGGRYGAVALATLAAGGRYLGFGAADGGFGHEGAPQPQGVEVLSLAEITADPALDWTVLVADAFTALVDGTAVPVVGQVFPLDRAADAHASVESRETVGRTLLSISSHA